MEKIGLEAVLEMAGFQSAMSSYLSGVDKMQGQTDTAASHATSAFDKIGGAIATVGKAAAAFTLAAVVGGVALLTGALVSSVKAAADAQTVEAQLDAVLKSTGASAAKAADDYDKASKTIVTGTKLSKEEIDKLSASLEAQKLKHSTLGAEIQEQKQRVYDLTQQWGDNGLATIKAKNKLAEMENQFKTGGSAIDALTRALKDGAIPTTTTLAQKLGLTAPAARMTKDELIKLADSLMGVTRFEDEAIIGAESMLLTFTSIGKDVFPMATETVLDMSQALGQDLKSSSMQLGKALNDPIAGITALRRVGVQFTDAQEAMIKKMVEAGDVAGAQKLILQELQTEFGGSARAAGQTFAGQLDILKNKFGNIQEIIGGAILPVLQQFASTLIGVLSSPELAAAVDSIVSVVGRIASGVGETVNAFIRVFQGAPGAVIGLQVALSNLFGVSVGQVEAWYTGLQTFLAPVIALFTTTIPAALGILQGIWALVWPQLALIANAVWANMQAMINIVVTEVLPIVQMAFAGLVAWFQENWPAIETLLLTVWGVFSAAILTIQTVVIPMLLAAFGVAIAWVRENWPWIQTTIETVMNAVLAVVTAVINTVAPFIMEMLGRVTAWTRDNWPLISQTITTVLNAVKSVVQAVLTFVTDFWQQHGDHIMAIATSVWTIIRTVIETVINTILGIIKAVMQAINGDWEGAWTTLQGVGEGIWEAIKVYAEEWIKILTNLFAIFYPILKDAWEKAWTWIKTTAIGIWDGITTTADTWATALETAVDTMLTNIKTAMSTMWTNIKTDLQTAWTSIKDWLTTTWESIKTMFTTGFSTLVTTAGQFGRDVMTAIKNGILAIKLPIPTFRIEWVEGPFGVKLPDIVTGVRWATIGSMITQGTEPQGAGGGGAGMNAAGAATSSVMSALGFDNPGFGMGGGFANPSFGNEQPGIGNPGFGYGDLPGIGKPGFGYGGEAPGSGGLKTKLPGKGGDVPGIPGDVGGKGSTLPGTEVPGSGVGPKKKLPGDDTGGGYYGTLPWDKPGFGYGGEAPGGGVFGNPFWDPILRRIGGGTGGGGGGSGGGGSGGGSGFGGDVLDVLKHIDDLVYNILMSITGQGVSTAYGGTRVTPAAGALGSVSSATTVQYNLVAQYRTMESESTLRDTVRMMEMAGAY